MMCVGRGHKNYCVIATGNQNILIRCAEHHLADHLRYAFGSIDAQTSEYVILSEHSESKDLRTNFT